MDSMKSWNSVLSDDRFCILYLLPMWQVKEDLDE